MLERCIFSPKEHRNILAVNRALCPWEGVLFSFENVLEYILIRGKKCLILKLTDTNQLGSAGLGHVLRLALKPKDASNSWAAPSTQVVDGFVPQNLLIFMNFYFETFKTLISIILCLVTVKKI